MLKSSFNAIANDQTKIVILGSLPGDKSLEEKQYYAHPTNQFWRLISGVIEEDLTRYAYRDRLDALLAARIGLWDVIASASRVGSLDSQIRNPANNRLDLLQKGLPNLKCIAFNGQKSAKVARKLLHSTSNFSLIDLPSSSAGYCSVTLEWKQHQWNQLKRHL